MKKLLNKLSSDDLEEVKTVHLLAGAIGLSLILYLVFYFTLHSATNEEFKKLTKQKKIAERTLKEYRSALSKEGLVVKNMARVRSRLNVFKNQMPSQDEIPTLIRRLTEFSKNRNIKITALTMEEGAVKNFYKEIPFKVEITGELWDTLDFIEYVQNLLRLVSFENLILQGQVNSLSDAERLGVPAGWLHTTLTAKTYSFLDGYEESFNTKKIKPNSVPAVKKKI
jgi:Tfp pilus assembly protein PilO